MPPGLACVVTPAGELELDGSGKPVERDTGDAARWAVSGRVEYDNKGQVIRVYQPYFIDRASHVNDAQARSWGHADTHAYDPLGREVAVITALGHKRRTSYFPWFDMSEDENDTLGDVSPSTAIEGKATPNMPITRGAFPSSIAIANAGTVGTLGVTVELTYTSGAFVRVELTSPAGQTVALPNVHSSPDDQVLSHVSTEQSSPLSPFIGQGMQGSWTLKISEFGSTREMRGIFSRWSLTITPADAARRHPQ